MPNVCMARVRLDAVQDLHT